MKDRVPKFQVGQTIEWEVFGPANGWQKKTGVVRAILDPNEPASEALAKLGIQFESVRLDARNRVLSVKRYLVEIGKQPKTGRAIFAAPDLGRAEKRGRVIR